MKLDLKWLIPAVAPFAIMAWVDLFVWVFGFTWQGDARTVVAVSVFCISAVAGLLVTAADPDLIRWPVTIRWPEPRANTTAAPSRASVPDTLPGQRAASKEGGDA